MPRAISSVANPLVKDVRKALRQGTLTEGGYCVAEGPRLLDEARRSSSKIDSILVAVSVLEKLLHSSERLIAVEDRVFEAIAGTETTQGVIALIEPPYWKIEQLVTRDSLIVVLDGIQDPGNAGTIMRAAEAFGATGVIFAKGSVNPFNAKVLRASAGSLFRIPFVYGSEVARVLAFFREHGIEPIAGVPCVNATPLPHADLTRPSALIVGNEGGGVSAEFRSAARLVTIPTGGVESLNAAIAAAVLLYEARRQRSFAR